MLKLIHFCGVWIKIDSIIPYLCISLPEIFVINVVAERKRERERANERARERERDQWVRGLTRKDRTSVDLAFFLVPILIQSCVIVTRCTLLYHLYIMLERKKQKEIEDYIFSIDPKMW